MNKYVFDFSPRCYLISWGRDAEGGSRFSAALGLFARIWVLCRWGKNLGVLRRVGTALSAKRGYFWKEKVLYKHVPEAQTGMGCLTSGKWAQKVECQNFFLCQPKS